ncbi:MAG: lysozyme [Arthrobacter sp.]|nr:lysozyme [Arthrobacter sp.]
MKWTPPFPTNQNGRRIGAVLLAAALLSGPLTAPPAGAVEPSPASTTTPAQARPVEGAQGAPSAPAPAPTPSPETAQPAPASPPTITAAPKPSPALDPSSDAGKAAMAQAVGPGGAEMGQRSPRISGGKAATTQALTTEGTWTPTFGIQGLDVSGHQPSINWQEQWNGGARFAYVKASEGNYYTNPLFGSQYQGSRNVGMIRGAYHFAIPNWSSGANQARYFVQNGGGWSADGSTLPPVLDFEFNPYAGRTIEGFYFGNTCYDMSPGQLASWVHDFGNTVRSLTGRLPVIYTNTSWWNQCLGNPSGFGDYPLWVASYPSSFTNNAGPIPTASWSRYSIWQYSSTGPFAGDSNVWNGSYADLRAFSRNGVPDSAYKAVGILVASTPSLGAQTSGIVCGLRDGGCFQGFAGGVVMWSLGSGAQPSLAGPIRNAWAGSGYESGVMGYPTSAVVCGLKGSGCFQNYQRGAIMWSPASGAAISTFGAIRDFWQQQNFENGPLGYPTSNAVCGLKNGGCFQNYQGGTVVWSPATGAQTVLPGPVQQIWQRNAFENGLLGYPTGKQSCSAAANQCVQAFQGGTAAWSQTNGGWAIPHPSAASWQPAVVGYPVGAQVCGLRASGCFQNFQKGVLMYAPTSGAFQISGAMLREWQQSGYENGSLGYPTSGPTCQLKNGGCFQNFEKASILSSPTTGAHPVYVGPFLSTWGGSGFENGSLGYPTSHQFCGIKNGGCFQNFEGGTIMWSAATGAQPLTSQPVRTAWGKSGYENGSLGYPTGRIVCGLKNGGCFQNFEKGSIMWSPATGAHPMTLGPIQAAWSQQGFENGPRGYPTGTQTCSPDRSSCTQTFQGGKLNWTAAAGVRNERT